ncbi:MAG TPA: ATP-binding cassette domain-containing protein [Candidatus Tectomicrobia bacterium]|nr:ATP-binding cassette domain-containing protein [Candidatus Tectomicrobia bacterium]
MLLELDRIDTFRGAAHVLRGVSLRVGDGEAVCLVGRNGAGKTTTLESAMGLLPVRAGRIVLRDRDVTRAPAHARARLGLGYAPEDAGIFPDLTVAENLMLGKWLAQQGRGDGALVDERMRALFPELETLVDRRGLNLSGGQKKMVAIARALALAPAVLLLDEPFEGLAPVVVTRLVEAARRIKAMGVSLLIAESNVTNAARVADRLYAIDRGEILFEGPPARALDNVEVMKTLRG